MASGSKPKTEEELAAMKAKNNEAAQAFSDRQRVVVGGQALGQGTGDRITLSEDGQSFLSGYTGSGNRGKFTFNPITGRYHNDGGDIVDLGQIAQQVQAESEGGGGQVPTPTNPVVGQDEMIDPGSTTEDVVGGYQNMMNWSPISQQIGGGGIQGMNPLADPNNWMHQLTPQPVRSPGRYIGQGIGLLQQNYNNGLLGGG